MLLHKHEQHMVPDYCAKYEQNHHILLCDITTLKMFEQMAIITTNLAQSQIVIYMHQWPIVPDHGTKYEENPPSYHRQMCEGGQMD